MEEHYRYLMELQNAGIRRADADPAELLRRVDQYLYPEVGVQHEYQELIEWMYGGYVQHYGMDFNWQILAVEHAPVVRLPTPTGGRSSFWLKLKIDLIVKELDTGNIFIVDHKSGANLPKGKELDIDDQFGLYTWALRQLGKKVFGSIHNAARTQRNKDQVAHFQPLDERFARHRMFRTDGELDVIAVEAYRAMRRAYAIKPGEADRAPNTDTCKWKCDFLEACLLGRKGRDEHQFLRDTGYYQDFERH